MRGGRRDKERDGGRERGRRERDSRREREGGERLRDEDRASNIAGFISHLWLYLAASH